MAKNRDDERLISVQDLPMRWCYGNFKGLLSDEPSKLECRILST